MHKITPRLIGAFLLSWIAGIACLFIALQFSPPRWSPAAMGGALSAAAQSSILYVLPPLLVLALWTLGRATVSAFIAGAVALVWVVLTVAWWAASFDPVPWVGALRNMLILMPGVLVPALVFYFAVRQT
jgi:hypothetical protein